MLCNCGNWPIFFKGIISAWIKNSLCLWGCKSSINLPSRLSHSNAQRRCSFVYIKDANSDGTIDYVGWNYYSLWLLYRCIRIAESPLWVRTLVNKKATVIYQDITALLMSCEFTVISPEGSNYCNHKFPSSTASINVEEYDDMQMDDE